MMKKIVLTLILSLGIQMCFAQACGKYRIRYVANIETHSIQIEKVKLATTALLHGLVNANSEYAFIEIQPTGDRIELEMYSHLTSVLFQAEHLFNFYKSKRESIPMIFVVIENGKEKEILKSLPWDKILISTVDDDKFGALFELNLGDIIMD